MSGRYDGLWDAPAIGGHDDEAPLTAVDALDSVVEQGRADETLLPDALADELLWDSGATHAVQPPNAPAPAHAVTLELTTGQRFALDRVVVVGRDPGTVPGVHGIAESGHPELSRAHVEIVPAPGGAIARDLGSANGTQLERGGASSTLTPGIPVSVAVGDSLVLAGVVGIRFAGAL